MRLAKSIFLLLFILTIHKCKAQYQAQRHYGDTLRYAYIVLFENENQLTSDKKLKIEQRLNQLSYLIKKESQGNLHIQAIPVYIDVHSLNLKSLHYKHHTFFNWIDCLMETGRIKPNIDIISFTPAIKMPWASDSHSIGFYYKSRVCFSLEYYSLDYLNNVKALGLLIHKMFHGFGYNHQNINMPALKLLNWELGFPVNTGLEYTLRGKDGYDAFYFNQHILNVLNTAKIKLKANSCLDYQGLVSKRSTYVKGLTKNAFGSHCFDADHDGIIDKDDDYFLSSPIQGHDSDDDGIPDKLDLVPWNKIQVTGNIDARKINLIAMENRSEIYFTGENVKINELKVTYLRNVKVQIKPDHFPGCFPKMEAISTKGNKLILERDVKKAPIVRIEVHYTYNGQQYYRPYYFYFSGTPILQIINEREWFYFSRFGADIPKTIDFYEVNTYDENYDGFVDSDKYSYFLIPVAYDWDGDSFPDLVDKLPTVYGKFENEYVSGVKDSDNDGLADPGYLDFSQPGPLISPSLYFGEIMRIIGENKDYDRSPYMKKATQPNYPDHDE